jgi:predicted ATPase/DNA-binding CsgD family transcriptional regulator/transcriptional regulator with XRE-family HTH domain
MPDVRPPAFGELLRSCRLAAGLTQEELGDRAGLSARGLSDLERGARRAARPETLRRLVAALGLGEAEGAALLAARRLAVSSAGSPDGTALRPTPGASADADRDRPGAGQRTELPAPVAPLIGREREVAAVRDRLTNPDVRLVTLTGPGGIGKTRLALHVAAELGDRFADGACFVPLASVGDPDLVVPSIAQALGLREVGRSSLAERVKEHLRHRTLLLLLDNFEHVLPAATIVADLLAAAPGAKALVTSRAVLRLSGEHAVALQPLTLPDPASTPGVEQLARYEATRLFVDRAAAASSRFAVSEANAPTIAAICRRLEGLPLAIELAAARIRLLPPRALLARLESALGALPLLVGGAGDLPARQQTLRSAIVWSHDLLDADHRRLFHRLAAFAGGCSIDAAEAVCDAIGAVGLDTLTGLGTLVDHSLLLQEEPAGAVEPDGEPRFRMLETIREFALECLERGGEAAPVKQAHAAYYLALAERSELTSGAQAVWLGRLEAEHQNFRAALAWSLEHDAETALRLSGALWRFWYMRGHLSEGRRWLDRALAGAGDGQTAWRARALCGAGVLAHYQSDHRRAAALCEESLAISRALGDRAGEAAALNGLALVARMGDYPAARALYEASLAIMRELGDGWGVAYTLTYAGIAAWIHGEAGARPTIEEGLALFRRSGDSMGIARALNMLGDVAWAEGDLAAARASASEALAIMRETGDRLGSTRSVMTLAWVAAGQGDHALARRLYAECAAELNELGDSDSVALCLDGLAVSAAELGQPASATLLLGAASALRDEISGGVPAAMRDRHERTVRTARAGLDGEAFAAAWARGRAMRPEQAIGEALASEASEPRAGAEPGSAAAAGPGGRRPAPAGGRLTAREREVAELVASGLTNRQVADRLVVAETTVERHVANIFAKLGVHSRAQVAAWAVVQPDR